MAREVETQQQMAAERRRIQREEIIEGVDTTTPPFSGAHGDLTGVTEEQHQDLVTLSAEADAVLDLADQELDLDLQAENTVFKGPDAAPAAKPTFTALVVADIPALGYVSSVTGGVNIDLTGAAATPTVNQAGNVVLLFDSGWAVLREYAEDGSGTGFAAALAAAASGDVVQLQAGTVAGDHTIPANIEVVGIGYNSVLSGTITNNGIITDCRLTGTLINNGRVRFSSTNAVDFLLQGDGTIIPTSPLGYPFMAVVGSPHETIPWGIMQDGADDVTPTMILFETSSGHLGDLGTGYRNATGAIVLRGGSEKRLHLLANDQHPKTDTPHFAIDITGRIGIYKDVAAAQFDIQSAAPDVVALIARGVAGQTVDTVQALNSGGTILSALTRTGAVLIIEQATPDTPAGSYGLIYFKVDGKAYSLNDAGEEVELGGDPAGVVGIVFSQTSDVAVEGTDSETTLLGVGRGTQTLEANIFEEGTIVRLTMRGYFSNTGTPTLNIKVKLGGAEVCSTGVITTLSGIDELGWSLTADIICRTTGAGGAVVAAGMFEYNDDSGHRLTKTGTTGADTTGGLLVDATATWGTDDVDNAMVCQGATIELMRADDLTAAEYRLLKETGSYLLLETGDFILLE